MPPSGKRVKLPLMPLYCAVKNRLDPMICESSNFQVFCGVVWSQEVGCGRVGPALRPNFSLSLLRYQTSNALDGTICQLAFALKSSRVVRSRSPFAVTRLI